MCSAQLSSLSALSVPSVEKLGVLKFTKWTQAEVRESHSTVGDNDPFKASSAMGLLKMAVGSPDLLWTCVPMLEPV